MFKLLQSLHQKSPKYARTYRNHALRSRNIFTVPKTDISHDKLLLLEDLYGRNTFLEKLIAEQSNLLQETDNLLKQQTDTIIKHTRNEEPLDLEQLKQIEDEIRNNFTILAESAQYCESTVSEYRRHAK